MPEQRRLELIVADSSDLYTFASAHPQGFSSNDLVTSLLPKYQKCEMEKEGIPDSRGIILREKRGKSHFYNIRYQIVGQEPKSIRLPKSNYYSEDVLISKLSQGLQEIHNGIEKSGQMGLILACEISDAETIKQKFTKLGYTINHWGYKPS